MHSIGDIDSLTGNNSDAPPTVEGRHRLHPLDLFFFFLPHTTVGVILWILRVSLRRCSGNVLGISAAQLMTSAGLVVVAVLSTPLNLGQG